MAIKIDKPIVDYKVAPHEPPAAQRTSRAPSDGVAAVIGGKEGPRGEVVHMHEQLERPPLLRGSTYKIKTPQSEHAMYVTINHITLNEGTEHELRRPFEVFINSKNMDHFQWIVALTRIISAVFRKGGDVNFLVEELHSVFDPKGGYFKRGGKYVPSLVAELGTVIEQHLIEIGLLEKPGLDEHQQAHVDEARTKYEHAQGSGFDSNSASDTTSGSPTGSEFPERAVLCTKCHTKAMVQLDGCLTCLNCGESKCA